MTTYILLTPIALIIIFIILIIFTLKYTVRNALNQPLRLEKEIIKITYEITKECNTPSFNNYKLVKGEPPYVKFDFKDMFYLTNSTFELLPILENGVYEVHSKLENTKYHSILKWIRKAIGADFHFLSTVPAQLGYKLFRCTMYPNRNKIFNVYELIEIQEKHLIFKKIATIDNFALPIDYQSAEFKKALAFVDFMVERNIEQTATEKELREQFEKRN